VRTGEELLEVLTSMHLSFKDSHAPTMLIVGGLADLAR
jgi:hypothetical protein